MTGPCAACESESRQPAHLLHLIDSLAPGGAERVVVELANGMAAAGQQVSVCATRAGGPLQAQLRSHVPVWLLNRRRRFDWAAMRRFSAGLRERQIDLLHVHGRSTLSLVALMRLLRMAPQPVVFHDHLGIEIDPSIPRWFRLLGRRSIDAYVGTYPRLREWAVAAGIPANRVYVIENALDFSRVQNAAPADLRAAFELPPNRPVGVVVGHLCREKGIDLLIQAVEMSPRARQALFVLIGGDRDPAYAAARREQVNTAGLTDTIRFVGERTDVPALLKGGDFAVLGSRSESGPVALLEYMAAGRPFVCTQVGAIADRVAALGIPGIVPKENPTALASALEELLSLSPEERHRRGQRGEDAALAHFSLSSTLPAWRKVYAAALARGGS